MATPARSDTAYRTGYRRTVVTQDLTIVFRVIGAIAAAVLVVFGLIALARIDWGNGGLDASAVQVDDVTFTPVVAIVTTAAGVLALLAAATRGRTSKIVVGALLVCGGIVGFVARPESGRVVLEDAHAWLMLIVGGVLILAALAMSFGESRSVVDTDPVYE